MGNESGSSERRGPQPDGGLAERQQQEEQKVADIKARQKRLGHVQTDSQPEPSVTDKMEQQEREGREEQERQRLAEEERQRAEAAAQQQPPQ